MSFAFTPDDWPQISALLEDALGLPEPLHQSWLDALAPEARRHREALARLLASHARAQTQDFLNSLPRIGLSDPDVGEDAQAGIAGATVGPYRLLSELGRGGMSRVWLAERSDGALKRPVALKLPHRGVAAEAFAERLARERDILAQLTHPNIARLYDAGVSTQGQPYLALEYVAGHDLLAYAQAGHLGVRERLVLFLQVLDAVQFAHAHLVIHRDLKPGNVLVDGEGRVKLLDFGIAKLLSDGERTAVATELTEIGGHALTPEYASPEQMGAAPLGIASDVYSLGVLLFELLTGERPYRLQRGSRAELEEAILHVEPRRPSEVAPALKRALRGELDAIVRKALAKAPAQRYATAEAFARDIQRHLNGEAVLARPESRAQRVQRFVRHHRVPVAAGAVALLAVLCGSGAALWGAAQAREQARRAEAEALALGGVGDFMMRTFSRLAASPALTGSTGRQVLGDAMRAELKRAETANQGNPQAMAAVAGHASAMFNYIGEQPETLNWAERQLQLLRQAGEPPNAIGESERLVALGYYRGGDYEKSLAHLRAGLELVKPARDEDTRVLRARLWRASGNALSAMERFTQSRDALEAARETLLPDLREDKQYYGAACIDLARVYDELDDPGKAQALLDEVRTIYSRQPGLADSEMGGLEWGQGVLHLSHARYAEAEAALRRSAQLYAVQFGTESPNAAGIEALIARAVGKQGRVDEARALLEHALPILRRGHSWRLIERALHARAELELDHGQPGRAAPFVDEIRRAVAGRPASEAWALAFEARLAAATGRNEEARSLAAQARAKGEQVFASAPRLRRLFSAAVHEADIAAGTPVQGRLTAWPENVNTPLAGGPAGRPS